MLNFKAIFIAILYYTFLPKRKLLLPTSLKIRGFVGSQNGANIHRSVPISLCHLPTNLYTSAVDFVKFRRLVEEALNLQRVTFDYVDYLQKAKARSGMHNIITTLAK